MKVLLTGGSGNLGQALVPRQLGKGDTPLILDVRAPPLLKQGAAFIEGSVLDRSKLTGILRGCDGIVHIAAWHGIHEDRGEKDAYDFFDLNVRGTFEVFEAAASAGIGKVIFISTTSVYRPDTRYGSSKILAELIAEDYRKHRLINVVTLRPRGFIPYWDRAVYAKYSDWARWFWKGAVHIDDVATAVILGLDLLSRRQLDRQLVLTLDSAYEYTDADLDHWDAEGPGSTFRKYYPEYYDLALSYGLDPALKPTKLDISETVRWLGYKPAYSLANLLSELAAFGDSPLHLELIQGGGCASRVTLRCRLQQGGSAYNGHFGCTCYHPLFAAADVYGNLVAHRPATGAARSGVTAAVSDETDDEGRGVAGMKQSH